MSSGVHAPGVLLDAAVPSHARDPSTWLSTFPPFLPSFCTNGARGTPPLSFHVFLTQGQAVLGARGILCVLGAVTPPAPPVSVWAPQPLSVNGLYVRPYAPTAQKRGVPLGVNFVSRSFFPSPGIYGGYEFLPFAFQPGSQHSWTHPPSGRCPHGLAITAALAPSPETCDSGRIGPHRKDVHFHRGRRLRARRHGTARSFVSGVARSQGCPYRGRTEA
ncbi:hypothetical protein B0H16DRAFT_1458025 [Mycena metata]|uniref:Uncharacterized protein n=1 Tax=Mycena metata TaxID=1033252 RepID=A0AAD7J572_9AGAR|nr:hypothetical protein B0H16DRAFT_1458025 [Mycena metata]